MASKPSARELRLARTLAPLHAALGGAELALGAKHAAAARKADVDAVAPPLAIEDKLESAPSRAAIPTLTLSAAAGLQWSDPLLTVAVLDALLEAGHDFCPTDVFDAVRAGRLDLVAWARENGAMSTEAARETGLAPAAAARATLPPARIGHYYPFVGGNSLMAIAAAELRDVRALERLAAYLHTPRFPGDPFAARTGSRAAAYTFLQSAYDNPAALRWLGVGGGLARYYLRTPPAWRVGSGNDKYHLALVRRRSPAVAITTSPASATQISTSDPWICLPESSVLVSDLHAIVADHVANAVWNRDRARLAALEAVRAVLKTGSRARL